jgi:hypothetical protein
MLDISTVRKSPLKFLQSHLSVRQKLLENSIPAKLTAVSRSDKLQNVLHEPNKNGDSKIYFFNILTRISQESPLT